MYGLLKQLLFVLEQLLARDDVVNSMHLNVWNAWALVLILHLDRISPRSAVSITETHRLSLIFVPIFSFISFEIFLLMVFCIAVIGRWIFFLNPIRGSLGGSLRNHIHSWIIAVPSLHVHLQHLLLLPSLNRLEL